MVRFVLPSRTARSWLPSPPPGNPVVESSHSGSVGRGSSSCGLATCLAGFTCSWLPEAGGGVVASGAVGMRTVASFVVWFGFSVHATGIVAGVVAAPAAVNGVSWRPNASAAKFTGPGPASLTGGAVPVRSTTRSPVDGSGAFGAVRLGQMEVCRSSLCVTTTERSTFSVTDAAPNVVRSPSATCGIVSFAVTSAGAIGPPLAADSGKVAPTCNCACCAPDGNWQV